MVLDELDWELDRRGHRFARYADDSNILVKSKRAGERVLASFTRWIDDTLRLTVNPRKSAVDRPYKRKFLGFTVSRSGAKLKVADQAIDKIKHQIRTLTRRTRGRRLDHIIAELRETLLGGQVFAPAKPAFPPSMAVKAYFGIAEVLSPRQLLHALLYLVHPWTRLRDIDKWIRRKLRCYQWKQWGRAGYRELRKRGVTVREAWNTSKSAHGPWRLSKTPALTLALPARYFISMELPALVAR